MAARIGGYVDPDDPGYAPAPALEAALALAERVTGVALTAELLHDASWLAVAVPNPQTDRHLINETEPEIRSTR